VCRTFVANNNDATKNLHTLQLQELFIWPQILPKFSSAYQDKVLMRLPVFVIWKVSCCEYCSII